MKNVFYRGYYIAPHYTPCGRRFGFEALTSDLKPAKFWALKPSSVKRAIDEWWLNGGRATYVRKYWAGLPLLRRT